MRTTTRIAIAGLAAFGLTATAAQAQACACRVAHHRHHTAHYRHAVYGYSSYRPSYGVSAYRPAYVYDAWDAPYVYRSYYDWTYVPPPRTYVTYGDWDDGWRWRWRHHHWHGRHWGW